MFSKEDFVIDNPKDLISFLIILPFVGLVAPFLIAAYKVGLLQDITGWLDS